MSRLPLHKTPLSDIQLLLSHAVYPSLSPAHIASSPTPDPYSVALADPVAGLFALPAPLIILESSEKPELMLPTAAALDTSIRRLLDAPCPIWLRTDVSDSQLVPSHAVWPNRADTQPPANPMLAPCTVTLADPVVPRFARRAALAVSERPIEKPRDLLPASKPTVSDSRLLPSTPDPVWHRTDVSEIHPVLSHAVRPSFSAPDPATSPARPPYRVTLTDPDEAALPRPMLLSHPAPYDTPTLVLDTRRPADIEARRLPDIPPAIRPRTNVSDCHAVRSHALRPTLKAALKPESPKLAPCTVTLLVPVAAALAPRTTLAAPCPKDRLRDTLPARAPTVVVTFRLGPMLAAPWQRVDVSDSHLVASQAVDPTTSPPL